MLSICFFLISLFLPATAAAKQEPIGGNPAIPVQQQISAKEIFDRCSPAVLRVESYQYGNTTPIATGTGFFISGKGDFVTNWHVVEDADYIHIVTPSLAIFPVDNVLAYSAADDIIVFGLKAKPSVHLALNDGTIPSVGERAYAIGNPLGMNNSLSDGLISGIRQLDNQKKLIQTTTPISPGSSGGPLINDRGQAVGITSSTFRGGQNINFAIPSNRVVEVLKQSPQAVSIERVLPRSIELAKILSTVAKPKLVRNYPADSFLDLAQRGKSFKIRIHVNVESRDVSIKRLLETDIKIVLNQLDASSIEKNQFEISKDPINSDIHFSVIATPIGNGEDPEDYALSFVSHYIIDRRRNDVPTSENSSSDPQHHCIIAPARDFSSHAQIHTLFHCTKMIDEARNAFNRVSAENRVSRNECVKCGQSRLNIAPDKPCPNCFFIP